MCVLMFPGFRLNFFLLFRLWFFVVFRLSLLFSLSLFFLLLLPFHPGPLVPCLPSPPLAVSLCLSLSSLLLARVVSSPLPLLKLYYCFLLDLVVCLPLTLLLLLLLLLPLCGFRSVLFSIRLIKTLTYLFMFSNLKDTTD